VSSVPSCSATSHALTTTASHRLSTTTDSAAETAAPNDVDFDVTPAQLGDDKFTRSSGDMRKSMETTNVIGKDKYDDKDAVAGR